MSRFALSLAGAALLLLLAACRGGDASSIRVLLEADLGQPATEVEREAQIDRLTDFFERRGAAFGATGVDIQQEGSNRFSVTLHDIAGIASTEDASRLMTGDPSLDLRKPVLDDAENIICQEEGGAEFSISPERLAYVAGPPDNRVLPRCADDAGRTGEIRWESAISAQPETDPFALILIQPSGAIVDRSKAPAVVVRFTQDAVPIIAGATENIVGFPLGIFIDGALIAAPLIRETITTGVLVIPDLSLPEAYVLAAQISSGRLPLPLTVISAEKVP